MQISKNSWNRIFCFQKVRATHLSPHMSLLKLKSTAGDENTQSLRKSGTHTQHSNPQASDTKMTAIQQKPREQSPSLRFKAEHEYAENTAKFRDLAVLKYFEAPEKTSKPSSIWVTLKTEFCPESPANERVICFTSKTSSSHAPLEDTEQQICKSRDTSVWSTCFSPNLSHSVCSPLNKHFWFSVQNLPY